MRLVLASKNAGKLNEMRKILSALGIEVITQQEAGVDIDVEETGRTFEENAILKAKAVMKATGMPALADDSGLSVEALGGAPGIYSARYGGEKVKTDAERCALLIEKLGNVERRTARFISCIACAFPNGDVLTAEGVCWGEITLTPRGKGGFGYDPVFFVPEYGQTMAEMTEQLKNKISHRARALENMKKELEKYVYAQ